MRSKKKLFLTSILLSLCMGMTVNAQTTQSLEDLQQTQTTEETKEETKTATADASQQQLVPVMIKADVPEGFTGNVTVQYTAKNTEGFTATLTKDQEYECLLTIARDKYVYKQCSIADGYSITANETFSLTKAVAGKTYYLPVIVNPGATEAEETATLLFTTDFTGVQKVQVEGEEQMPYIGPVTLSYSGTEGNSLSVNLNEENGYTSEILAKKDIYTLTNASVTDGYDYDCLYSFSTMNAVPDVSYEMIVNISTYDPNKEEEMLEEWIEPVVEQEPVVEETVEEEAEITKTVMFSLDVPNYMQETFVNTVYVSYQTVEGEECSFELSKENNYLAITEVPLGNYGLVYAVSMDSSEYTYQGQEQLLITENTPAGLQVAFNILKEGTVLTDEEVKESGSNSNLTTIFGILMLLVVAGVCVYFGFIKNKGNKPNVDVDDIDDEEEDDDEDVE